MNEFEHIKPEDSFAEKGYYVHTLELRDGERKIGEAELIYKNDPFPFYYLSTIQIKEEEQDKGHGGQIIDQVNQFLEDKGKAGILLEMLDPGERGYGMAKRRGWQEVESEEMERWYTYNLPENISQESVVKATESILKTLEKMDEGDKEQ